MSRKINIKDTKEAYVLNEIIKDRPKALIFPTALDAKKVYQETDIIEWANTKISEANGDWEVDKYHEGYKDAMNDLIRFLSN